MKLEITSEVMLFGMKVIDTYVHDFPDDLNVFGRVLEYHERMYKVFPGCEFRLVGTKEVK